MRRYFTRRCLALHAMLLVLLPTFALLTKWQLDRALGGNTLSWAYTFEWPLFAGYAVYMWWQLVRDNTVPGRLPAGAPLGHTVGDGDHAAVGGRAKPGYLEPGWALNGGRERNVAIAAATAEPDRTRWGTRYREQTPEEAKELAAYNEYLAELAEADEATSGRP